MEGGTPLPSSLCTFPVSGATQLPTNHLSVFCWPLVWMSVLTSDGIRPRGNWNYREAKAPAKSKLCLPMALFSSLKTFLLITFFSGGCENPTWSDLDFERMVWVLQRGCEASDAPGKLQVGIRCQRAHQRLLFLLGGGTRRQNGAWRGGEEVVGHPRTHPRGQFLRRPRLRATSSAAPVQFHSFHLVLHWGEANNE